MDSSLDYIEFSCQLDPPEPWREILIAQLADAGFESFEETGQGLKAWIRHDEFDDLQLQQALQLEAGDQLRMSHQVSVIGPQNWNQIWESRFEPIWIGKSCHIRAPFHEPDQTAGLELIIEPKMSFGTGHHETTSLVAEWLLETPLLHRSMLDMGCGTGILAILAAKKGAAPVTAIDNYVYAWENTLENCERNEVGHLVEVLHGDASLLGSQRFDVIAANITRNILLEDMPAYCSVLNQGGILFLSGFLAHDRDEIIKRGVSLGLRFEGDKTNGDWVSVKLSKA